MKSLHNLIATLFLSFLTIATTSAEVEMEIELNGHLAAKYGSSRTEFPNRDAHLGDMDLDIWPILTLRGQNTEFTINTDLSEVLVDDSNWLKAAFLLYAPSEDDIFTIGRIGTTGLELTAPARYLETVYFQNAPVGVWAYGAQWKHKDGRWITMFDISTDSDDTFHDFEGLDTGLRVMYDLSKCWSIAGGTVVDVDDKTFFNYVDVAFVNEGFGFHFVGYDNDNTFGLYSLTKLQVLKKLEVHYGLDAQEGGSFSHVIGTRYSFDEVLDLTLDYTHSTFAGEDKNMISLRLRQLLKF